MRIAPGVHSLGNTSGGRVRAFLLDDGSGLTLIDTLLHKDGRLVLEELRAMGREPRDIKRIILTHAHPSHLGGLAALKKASGATVYAHEWEAEIIAGRRKIAVPLTTTFMPQQPLRVYPLQVAFVLGLGVHPPCEVDENIKEGDHIGPLTTIHVPGHTPGSFAFSWPAKRALFVGDVVVTWPHLALGWPQITLDNRQNRESVGKLTDFSSVDVVGVGHGDPLTAGGADALRRLTRKNGDRHRPTA